MLCHTYTLSAIPGSRTVGHIPGIPNRANSQNTRPNSRVQVTPLARPVTRGVFRIRPVPTSVPISMPARGAPDADRWAALTPTCGCRTVRVVGEIAHHHVSLGIIGHHRISLSNRT